MCRKQSLPSTTFGWRAQLYDVWLLIRSWTRERVYTNALCTPVVRFNPRNELPAVEPYVLVGLWPANADRIWSS